MTLSFFVASIYRHNDTFQCGGSLKWQDNWLRSIELVNVYLSPNRFFAFTLPPPLFLSSVVRSIEWSLLGQCFAQYSTFSAMFETAASVQFYLVIDWEWRKLSLESSIPLTYSLLTNHQIFKIVLYIKISIPFNIYIIVKIAMLSNCQQAKSSRVSKINKYIYWYNCPI